MERLTMRQTREILRLRWVVGLSVREVSRATGTSTGVVSKTVHRAETARLTWERVDALTDPELDRRLYGGPKCSRSPERAEPNPLWMHQELRRAGVTLELLHLEYLQEHPDGLRYTAFCDRYRTWLGRQGVVMRQVHKAGEKSFIDYSGKKPSFVDKTSGEVIEVELFVAVLGASNLTFAEATLTQRAHDFVGSHMRAFAYFGGVPKMTVPDQLKSAVKTACRYEPLMNQTYSSLGSHYGFAIVPARPGKPRDKAKVEVAVQVAQRWVLARLRHETFFSLEALNARIRELVEELNARAMKRMGGVSRRELFERYERASLGPLPSERYEISTWHRARVAPDYHVQLEQHYYSAPYVLCREEVEACLTPTMVEIFHRGQRVASHARSHAKHGHTTDPAHMPEAHRAIFEAGERIEAWAASVGPMCAAFVKRLFESSPFREQGWRSARGLQRVGNKYGPKKLEAACERALVLGARSYKPVERILKLGRETIPLAGDASGERTPIEHSNVRGPNYFH